MCPKQVKTEAMELMPIGEINDMYAEMQRDEELHDPLASQDDFDNF